MTFEKQSLTELKVQIKIFVSPESFIPKVIRNKKFRSETEANKIPLFMDLFFTSS